MNITPDMIDLSDDVMAHLIPGCFEPKEGVKIDDVRDELKRIIALRGAADSMNFPDPESYIDIGGDFRILKLVPTQFKVVIAPQR